MTQRLIFLCTGENQGSGHLGVLFTQEKQGEGFWFRGRVLSTLPHSYLLTWSFSSVHIYFFFFQMMRGTIGARSLVWISVPYRAFCCQIEKSLTYADSCIICGGFRPGETDYLIKESRTTRKLLRGRGTLVQYHTWFIKIEFRGLTI